MDCFSDEGLWSFLSAEIRIEMIDNIGLGVFFSTGVFL